LQQAAELDEKKAAGKPLGKLAGVPIAIKDNIHIRDEITSCASKFLDNYKAPFDATVTKLIKEADGLIIGKTNLDEFAMGSATDNSAMHPTHNPWNLKCVPGGSSGGSAAAVAARLCPIALGSDTGGSVRQPASFTGTVGLKPTYGRTSRYGLVAFGSSFDQIGPITNSVHDAALMHEVLGVHCSHDGTSINQPSDICNFENIQGKKIGIPRALVNMAKPEVLEAFEKSLQIFKGLGAELIDIELPILRYGVPTYYILATAEASTNLARFDGIRYGRRSQVAEGLDAIYTKSRSEGFGPEVKQRILLGTYLLSSGFQKAFYQKAQKVRTLFIQGFKAVFATCDLILTPTSPGIAFEHGSIHDPLEMYLQDMYTIPANLAGLPAISIPAGLSTQHLPIGIQLMAPQMHESKLLSAAQAFESATDHVKIPPLFDQEVL
ncbi:MAG: Asp-tRNA(Asn)/Glu-tRNA(Gln) amidotransferase subunit GatA, partial [Chlamydiia bacterium]|nr:Asp-tRNA(Asn)/Glu-tRNA(Gln) amidotransferase subunit GatA [Chlamydiia bacterium]